MTIATAAPPSRVKGARTAMPSLGRGRPPPSAPVGNEAEQPVRASIGVIPDCAHDGERRR